MGASRNSNSQIQTLPQSQPQPCLSTAFGRPPEQHRSCPGVCTPCSGPGFSVEGTSLIQPERTGWGTTQQQQCGGCGAAVEEGNGAMWVEAVTPGGRGRGPGGCPETRFTVYTTVRAARWPHGGQVPCVLPCSTRKLIPRPPLPQPAGSCVPAPKPVSCLLSPGFFSIKARRH